MSAVAIPTSPKSPPSPRSRPRAVPPRESATRPVSGIGFLILVALFLGAGMFGLLMLNTAVQEQGFALADLKAQSKQLGDQADYLDSRLESARSPGGLAEAAGDLGMVPASNPSYLRLSDGVIVTADVADARGFQFIRTPRQQRKDAEASELAKQEAAAKAEREKQEAAAKAERDKQASASAAADKLKPVPPPAGTEAAAAGGNR